MAGDRPPRGTDPASASGLTRTELRLHGWTRGLAWMLLVLPAAVFVLSVLGSSAWGIVFLPLTDSTTEATNPMTRSTWMGVVDGAQCGALTALACLPLGAPLLVASRALAQPRRRIPQWAMGLVFACGCVPTWVQQVTEGLPGWFGPVFGAPAWCLALALGYVDWRYRR